MANIVDITAASFSDEVMNSPVPVLIDFHAVWCGPCKAMMPALEYMAREYDGEVKIVKVDVDAEAGIAADYEVKGVPTLILVKDGQARERVVGTTTRGKLAELFERYAEGGE